MRTIPTMRRENKSEAFAIWITGIPGCGKSTIAKRLAQILATYYGQKIEVLESDELRRMLTPKPSFDDKERRMFYTAMVVIGQRLVRKNIAVIFDATANKREYRASARRMINKFIEVYIRCPVSICMKRDPKGLYRKAKAGIIRSLPVKINQENDYIEDREVVDVMLPNQKEYEVPLQPEIIIRSDQESPEEVTRRIVKRLLELKFIKQQRLAE